MFLTKIIRAQLVCLFFTTIISFVSFYYSETLPDNILSISSDNASTSFLLYYATSLITLVEYFVGPWIFIPFITLALLYPFVLSKRLFKLDAFVILPILATSFYTFYFFFEIPIGNGLYQIISLLGTFINCLLYLVSLVVMFALIWRSSFRAATIALGNYLLQVPSKIMHFIQNVDFESLKVFVLKYFSIVKSFIALKVSHLLKRDLSTHKNSQSSSEVPNNITSNCGVIEKNQRKLDLLALPCSVDENKKSIEENCKHNELIIESENVITDNNEERLVVDSEDCAEIDNIDNNDISNDISSEMNSEISLGFDEKHEDVEKNVRPAIDINDLLIKEAADEARYFGLVNFAYDTRQRENKNIHPDDSYFTQIIERIEDRLSQFKIDGVITDVLKGPVVDTFLLELGKGVKVSKVTSSADDLSGALYGAPIRIVYPMKGRTSVGIEVPRNPREIIYLDEVLDHNDFEKADYTLPLAMGKDAYGLPFIVDLASMPHMLVAGSTGAGKSVFINSLLVSLLVKKSPNKMKLILIDPKQLELALYAKLPHLIMPVITDAKMASVSLMWAVQEMERRYSILKELGVRNLDGFNEKIKKATPEIIANIHDYYDESVVESDGYFLPYIVIIVDEFADLILTKAGKEIESNVCRLAGKARAAGIHLIVATQRPSVDVITGLIKSNFPTRVSFRVTTSIDSRTILSATGAEKLLGKGDMLYKRGVETVRLHSPFVDEDEIAVMVDNLTQYGVNYDKGAVEFLENGGEETSDPYAYGSHIPTQKTEGEADEDSLYEKAVEIVMEYRSASASMLQRRLKIGYNRAANLVEEMERKGIVGPAQGSKPRKVLSASDGPNNHEV